MPRRVSWGSITAAEAAETSGGTGTFFSASSAALSVAACSLAFVSLQRGVLSRSEADKEHILVESVRKTAEESLLAAEKPFPAEANQLCDWFPCSRSPSRKSRER